MKEAIEAPTSVESLVGNDQKEIYNAVMEAIHKDNLKASEKYHLPKFDTEKISN